MNTPHDNSFLNTAFTIGAKLCRDALWSGPRCNWMGDSKTMVAGQPTVIHTTLGPALYEGTAGIALFLARLFHHTGERLFQRTAHGAIQHALAHRERVPPSGISSYYTGQLGIAAAALDISTLTVCPSLAEQGMALLPAVLHAPIASQGLDLIAGSASAIPTLLHLYRDFGDDAFMQSAIRHGDHLMDAALPMATGIAWRMQHDGSVPPLCGYAHGASGMGLALLELFAITHDPRYREAAIAAFDYEESCFDPTEDNYPDFRRTEGEPVSETPKFMTAWCHGAPGIGIARTRAYELLPFPAFRASAERAAAATARHLDTLLDSPSLNYSLCHGAGGNAAFLLYAAQVFKTPSYRETAEAVGQSGIERYPEQRSPWICGVAGGGETPGLMLGTAGIGYFYLSLATGADLPPVTI